MATYNFSANGIDMGTFEADSIVDAKEMFAQSANYGTWADMVAQAEEFGGNNVEIEENGFRVE